MKYLKLGPKAKSFADQSSGVILSGKMVIEVKQSQTIRAKVAAALRGNHLEYATEKDFKAWLKFRDSKKVKTLPNASNKDLLKRLEALEKENAELVDENAELKIPKDPLLEMTKAELADHYNDGWEVSEEELVDFNKLSKDEMVDFINKLDE